MHRIRELIGCSHLVGGARIESVTAETSVSETNTNVTDLNNNKTTSPWIQQHSRVCVCVRSPLDFEGLPCGKNNRPAP